MPFRSNEEPATDDWALLCAVQANALLIGASKAVESSLAVIEPQLREPIVTWTPAMTALVPDGDCATLIIVGVTAMDVDQQRQLLKWLDVRSQSVQVISTSEAPLWPLVEAGAFLQSLYYRLNVMYVDVTGTPPVA